MAFPILIVCQLWETVENITAVQFHLLQLDRIRRTTKHDRLVSDSNTYTLWLMEKSLKGVCEAALNIDANIVANLNIDAKNLTNIFKIAKGGNMINMPLLKSLSSKTMEWISGD